MSKHEKKPGESFESLMRRFKRRVKSDGTLKALRDRERFEKPSEKKKKTLRAAQRRTYLQQKQDEV